MISLSAPMLNRRFIEIKDEQFYSISYDVKDFEDIVSVSQMLS